MSSAAATGAYPCGIAKNAKNAKNAKVSGARLVARRRTCRRERNISYEEFHPYGTTAWWTDPASTVSQKRYRYTGKEKDEESGLYYHGARYYAPWLSRWASADPSAMVDGSNRFVYVGGNPTGRRDSNGRWPDVAGYVERAANYAASRAEAAATGAAYAVASAVTSTETYQAVSAGVVAVSAAAMGDTNTANVAAQAASRHASAAVAGPYAASATGIAQHLGSGASAFRSGNVPLAAAHVVSAAEKSQNLIDEVKYELSLEGQVLNAGLGAVATVKLLSYDLPVETGTNIVAFASGDKEAASKAAASQLGLDTEVAAAGVGIALAVAAGGPRSAPVAVEGAGAAETAAAGSQSASFGWAKSFDYKKTFFDAYPELRGRKTFVHHAVEQQTLKRYPGVVKPEEIHSLENLRGVPDEWNPEIHLSVIRREWQKFYKANPKTTTKEALLQKATEVDNLVGRWFDPPNR